MGNVVVRFPPEASGYGNTETLLDCINLLALYSALLMGFFQACNGCEFIGKKHTVT